MPDIYVYTSKGYAVIDPDDAPTPDEQFAELIVWIWENADGNQRKVISHERYALGIKSKCNRDLTATEQAVYDAEIAYLAKADEWEDKRIEEALEAERQYWEAYWKSDEGLAEIERNRQQAEEYERFAAEYGDDLPY